MNPKKYLLTILIMVHSLTNKLCTMYKKNRTLSLSNKIRSDILNTYTGKGIKIAIIDTGVDSNHPVFNGCNVIKDGKVFYCYDNTIEECDYEGKDADELTKHGTSVAAIIHDIAKDAELYSIQVLKHKEGIIKKQTETEVKEQILAGIKYAIEKFNVNIINLSGGVTYLNSDSKLYKDLYELFKYRDDITIVCSCSNGLDESEFSTLQTVISVEGIKTDDKHEFHYFKNAKSEYKVDYLASSEYRYKDIDFSGNSCATPHITGIVALIKEKLEKENKNNTDNINTTLQDLANSKREIKYDAFILCDNKEWGTRFEDIEKDFNKKYTKYNKPYLKFYLNNDNGPVPFVVLKEEQKEKKDKKALEASKYLVVVCSVHRKRFDILRQRIEDFLTTGEKENNIIWLLTDSKYEDIIPRKFIETIEKKIKKKINIQTINIRPSYDKKENVFEKCYNEIYNTITGNDFSKLKKEMRNKKLLKMSIIMILIVSLGMCCNYIKPQTMYYNNIVYKYGVPQGISKLGMDAMKRTYLSYKFEYTWFSKLKSVSRINSYDKLIRRDYDSISKWVFHFNGERIAYVENKNEFGKTIFKSVYQSSGEDQNTDIVNFKYLDNVSYIIQNTKDTKDIHYYYNNNGYVTNEAHYKLYPDKPIANSRYYAKVFKVSQEGRVLRETWLNKDNQTNVALFNTAFEYDDNYNKTKEVEYTSHSNLFITNSITVFNYTNNNLVKTIYYDSKGNITTNEHGIAIEEHEYDDKGNRIVTSYRGIEYNRISFSKTPSITRSTYDDNGNIESKYSFDETEKQDNISEQYKHYHYSNEYSNGYRKTTTFKDKKDKPTTNGMIGSIVEEIFYSNNYSNFTRIIKRLDINGNLIKTNNNDIIPIEIEDYNEFEKIIRKSYFDDNDKPHYKEVLELGVYSNRHLIEYKYNIYKRTVSITYSDINSNRIGKVINIYRDTSISNTTLEIESEKYFGLDDETPIEAIRASKIINGARFTAHCVEWTYDEYGNIISERYFDTNNEPRISSNDYYGIAESYDDNGNITSRRYLGANDNYTLVNMIAGYNKSYDDNSKLVETTYVGTNNEPIIHSIEGVHKIRYKYDQYSRLVETTYFDQNTNLTPNNNGYAYERIYYDNLYRVIRQEYLDINEKFTMIENGYAYFEIDYYNGYTNYCDTNGNKVKPK